MHNFDFIPNNSCFSLISDSTNDHWHIPSDLRITDMYYFGKLSNGKEMRSLRQKNFLQKQKFPKYLFRPKNDRKSLKSHDIALNMSKLGVNWAGSPDENGLLHIYLIITNMY